MAKKVFQPYLTRIKDAISEPAYLSNKVVNFSSKAAGHTIKLLLEDVNDLTAETGLADLKRLLGKHYPLQVSAGDHPDFAYLRHSPDIKAKHYIVSVFIDVKNSTHFFRKYNDDQIALIIQTIQSAAIHTCTLFDGHIQRQQYDGLFLYFGGKNKTKEEAIEDALKAVGFFTYFMKYELPEIWDANDLDKIYTRAGIDFGDDHQVSWYIFGVNGCSELTTVSLHTSLAPKMQSHASQNGVMIGENLISRLPKLNNYSKVRVDGGIEVPLIFERPNYKQFEFDWQSYLVNVFPFIKRVDSGIEIDYEYDSSSDSSFYKKVELLNTDRAAISSVGVLGTQGHQITPTKFYGQL
jgi:class 3 adenylate cyclase